MEEKLPLVNVEAIATAQFVYLFRCGDFYKIGRSKNPAGRLETLDVGPVPVQMVHQILTDDPGWLERRFHRRYAERHVRGEWFALTPADVAEIISVSVCNRPPLLVRPRGRFRSTRRGRPISTGGGRGRIGLKYPPAFCDMVADTAQTSLVPLSQFVRDALIEHMERAGRKRADIHAALLSPPEPEKPARKRRKKP